MSEIKGRYGKDDTERAMKKAAEGWAEKALEGERASGAGATAQGGEVCGGGRINFLVRAGIANCLRTLFMV